MRLTAAGCFAISLFAVGVSLLAQPAASQLVFVGTYTNDHSRGIYAFRFDDRAGTLSPLGLAVDSPNPSFLTLSADRRILFAVNETQEYRGEKSGSVSSFAINAATGKLTTLSTVSSRGMDPCHLALDRTGKFLAVANYSSGTVSVLPVGPDGRLGDAVTVLALKGTGPNKERQEGPHAHQVIFSADNQFLTVLDLGTDRVLVYRFNATTGALTPNTPAFTAVSPGSGPRHLALGPDGRRAFVINEMASSISSFVWDGATGTLRRGATISTLPAGYSGTSTTAEIAVHPNGRFVYGSNRGHDSLAIFQLGADGVLKTLGFEPTRGKTPRHFAIAPSGQWLIAGNQDSGTLAVFRINQQTGRLTASGPLSDAGTPVCILFVS